MHDKVRGQDRNDHDQREGTEREDCDGAPAPARPGRVEWIVGGLSLLVVATMVGYILFQAFTATRTAPELQVLPGPVAAAGEGFRVEFRAINHGDGTAAAVVVEGELRRGEEVVETSTATIDYVPGNSERSGGLIFSRDPARYRLFLAPKGYADP